MSAIPVAFWQYVVVSASLAPLLLGAGRVLGPAVEEWPYVLALGILLTGVSGVLYIRTLRNVTAQAAGLLAYLEPVSASALACAILGQRLTWQVALGGAAVLAGGALVILYEPAEAVPVKAHAVDTAVSGADGRGIK